MYTFSTLIIASIFGMFRLANIKASETPTADIEGSFRPVPDHRDFPE